jgi:hypothetical protein
MIIPFPCQKSASRSSMGLAQQLAVPNIIVGARLRSEKRDPR